MSIDSDSFGSDQVLSNVNAFLDVVDTGERGVFLIGGELDPHLTPDEDMIDIPIDADGIYAASTDVFSQLSNGSVGSVNPFEDVVRNGEVYDSVEFSISTDGETQYIQLDAKPLRDNDDIVGGVFVLREITHVKVIEDKYNELATVVDALDEPLYVIDETGEFEYVNEAFTELTGYTVEEITEKSIVAVQAEQSISKANEKRNEVLAAGGNDTVTFDVVIETKSGEDIPCEDHLGVIESDNGFEGFAGVLRDVSARERRKTQLDRYRDKLKRVSESDEETAELSRQKKQLDEFVSVLTHDLRNPVNVARGYVDAAETEENTYEVEQIRQAMQRMETIISDTLELFGESGEVTEEDIESVSIYDLSTSAWGNVQTGGSNLRIANDVEIECSEKRAMRLFENVFRNAVEHNDDPVTVVVGEYSGVETSTRGEENAGFYIADDGVGIPESKRDEVFDFGESSSETGTGLGLSIVERVANAHGWDISVQSGPSDGAKFVFV